MTEKKLEGSIRVNDSFVFEGAYLERYGMRIEIAPAKEPTILTAGSDKFKEKFPNESNFFNGGIIRPEMFGIVEEPAIGRCFKVEMDKIIKNQQSFSPDICIDIEEAKKDIRYGKEFYLILLDCEKSKNGNIEIKYRSACASYSVPRNLTSNAILLIEDTELELSYGGVYEEVPIVESLMYAQLSLNGNKTYNLEREIIGIYIYYNEWAAGDNIFIFCDTRRYGDGEDALYKGYRKEWLKQGCDKYNAIEKRQRHKMLGQEFIPCCPSGRPKKDRFYGQI